MAEPVATAEPVLDYVEPDEHARLKGMWAGAHERTAIPRLEGLFQVQLPPLEAGGPPRAGWRVRPIASEHTPSLLKGVDELLVNASDHERGCRTHRKSDRVGVIRVTFDADGVISVYNDGPGIPQHEHEKATRARGRSISTLELVYGIFLTGSNIYKDADSVKGGINGVGAKIATISAKWLVARSTDGKRKICGVQRFRDRLTTREAVAYYKTDDPRLPEDARVPHTMVAYLPAYEELGYPADDAAGRRELGAFIRLRAHEIAAYIGPTVSVTFNGEPILTTSAELLARLACQDSPDAQIFSTSILPARGDERGAPRAAPWDVAVAVVPGKTKFTYTTMVNGVRSPKGAHLTHIKGVLTAAIEERLRARTRDRKTEVRASEATKPIHLVLAAPLRGADWDSQGKGELQVPAARVRGYAPAPAFLRQVALAAAEQILAARGHKGGRVKLDVRAEDYRKAALAGPGGRREQWARAALMVCEGLSAMGFLKAGLGETAARRGRRGRAPRAAAAGAPTAAEYGLFSLGGVPMNALQNSTAVALAGGRVRRVASEKAKAHKPFKNLMAVLGLDFACAYDTPEERAGLYYGSVIGCTDQDLDGTGKILPLFLVFIQTFWPALIQAGYVRRLITPVVRVYPKGRGRRAADAVAFFYEIDCERWLAADPARAQAHDVVYVKGLATNEDFEVAHLFRTCFHEHVYRFTLRTPSLVDAFYGADSAPRKAIMSRPPVYLTGEQAARIVRARVFPVEVLFAVDASLYKRAAIGRQIPHVVDGLKEAMRKVIAGAMGRFAKSNAPVKVFQLGGYIADNMYYHHGDASLYSTIINMTQRYPGGQGRQWPFLVGRGQFGSRHHGGSDAGSPRYVAVNLARPWALAVFPPADRYVYAYRFDDGQRAEPVFMPPVIPTSVIETHMVVSEVWSHRAYARKIEHVFALVDVLLAPGSEPLHALADRLVREGATPDLLLACGEQARRGLGMAITDWRFAGSFVAQGARRFCVGAYEVDESSDTVTVTELPLTTQTANYVAALLKPTARNGKVAPNFRDAFISGVDDQSAGEEVDVRITFRPGALARVRSGAGRDGLDPLVEFLMLRQAVADSLNYVGADGRILNLGGEYLAAVLFWYSARRDLYKVRLDRELAICELEEIRERETLRYIRGDAARLDLAHTADDAQASARLAACRPPYPAIDGALLRCPQYTPADELRRRVLEGGRRSHDYLLDLRQRDLVGAAAARRADELAALRARIATLRRQLATSPPGVEVWRDEVAKVKAAHARGVATGWRFG